MSVLFHIGYHKTGTTFLQKKLWNDKTRFILPIGGRKAIHTHFIDPFEKKSKKELFRQAETADKEGKIFILSHERLSGYPASGGFDSFLIADKIKKEFSDAKILIGIREQKSFLKSFYQQYICDGGTDSLKNFLENPQVNIFRTPKFHLDFLDYNILIKRYIELFGRGNVLILPFELLKVEESIFFSKLSEFLGFDTFCENIIVNKSQPLAMQLVRRYFVKYFVSSQLSPSGFIHVDKFDRYFDHFFKSLSFLHLFDKRIMKKWNNIIDYHISDYYLEKNLNLQNYIDYDLRKLGYY